MYCCANVPPTLRPGAAPSGSSSRQMALRTGLTVCSCAKRRFQHIDRRQVALGEAPRHLAGGKPVQLVRHAARSRNVVKPSNIASNMPRQAVGRSPSTRMADLRAIVHARQGLDSRFHRRGAWVRFLAAGYARALCNFSPSQGNRGRREDRVLAAPAVSRAICANKSAHEHTGQREHSGLPCAMALRLTSCSSRRTALLPPLSAGRFLANLAPAPRRPNHTTSPYASGAYVYRALSVHRISPRVRDVRERPSSAVRRAKLCD